MPARPDAGARGARARRRLIAGLRDEFSFVRAWATRPRETGGVAPSGRRLARAMAAQVDPAVPGAIVELGPGTGPITRALLARGIAPERLVLIEFNPQFAALLRSRFPGVTVIEGDAFDIARVVRAHAAGPVAAVVSGLPLFNQPMARRLRLLGQVLRLIDPRGCFVQFSYHLLPPVPARAGSFRLAGTRRIWRNMPPARVWIYRPAA